MPVISGEPYYFTVRYCGPDLAAWRDCSRGRIGAAMWGSFPCGCLVSGVGEVLAVSRFPVGLGRVPSLSMSPLMRGSWSWLG
jgi:hypothetical protein